MSLLMESSQFSECIFNETDDYLMGCYKQTFPLKVMSKLDNNFLLITILNSLIILPLKTQK